MRPQTPEETERHVRALFFYLLAAPAEVTL